MQNERDGIMNLVKGILDKKFQPMPSDYVGAYYLRHLVEWYGPLVKLYYKYIAQHCMIRPAKLKKGSKILDIGCGIGLLVYCFNKLGYDAKGIDVNPNAIACSLEPLNSICVEQSSKLPFPDNYFDLVVSREVLEHIPLSEIDNCIDEWERVGNGVFIHIIAVSDRGKRVINDPAHINVQSENWWIEKFTEHGYSVIRKPSKLYYYPYGSQGYLMMQKINK